MGKKNSNTKKQSYIYVPSQIINSLSSASLQSLLVSPKKSSRNHHYKYFSSLPAHRNPKLWVIVIFVFGFMGVMKIGFNLDPLIPFLKYPCSKSQSQRLNANEYLQSSISVSNTENVQMSEVLEATEREDKEGEGEGEGDGESFWKQPDGMGYRPCLDFSHEYRKESLEVVNDRTKYLMVVVSGGMNQQRNQIVDAVVIARILGAALVVPILQVNVIWGDERQRTLRNFTFLAGFLQIGLFFRQFGSFLELYNLVQTILLKSNFWQCPISLNIVDC